MKKISILLFLLIIFPLLKNIAQTNVYCKYQTNVDEYYKAIIEDLNKEQIFKDSCTLTLLDTLKIKYLKTTNNKYLDVIDKIATYSDGYLSEYVNDIVYELTIANTENFINYLCSHSKNMDSGMAFFFSQILSHSKTTSKFYLQVNNYMEAKGQKKCNNCVSKIKSIIEVK